MVARSDRMSSAELRAQQPQGSHGERVLELLLRHAEVAYEREVQFHPTRKWRFDFTVPSAMLAIEVEGGIFKQGRHSRGDGFRRDVEKYAEAAILGWRVLRVSTDEVKNGKALRWIRRALEV